MIEHHFIVDIFNQFGMANCKPAYTLLPKGFTLVMSIKNLSFKLIQLLLLNFNWSINLLMQHINKHCVCSKGVLTHPQAPW